MAKAQLLIAALLLTLCGFAQPGSAAEIGICSTTLQPTAQMRARPFYAASGEQQQLVISDVALDTSLCDSLELPQPAAMLLWASLLPVPDAAINRLTLQGNFGEKVATVSEIIASTATVPVATTDTPAPSPLAEFSAIVFGIEERASWTEAQVLTCRSGNSVAGVQLITGENWPPGMQLQIAGSGQGVFQLAAADADHLRDESALPVGTLTLRRASGVQRENFVLPDNNAPFTALTLLCPETPADLRIHGLSVQAQPAQRETARAAWIWRPTLWQQNPEFFWSLHAQENIDTFFITVPVNAIGEVAEQSGLRQFVRQATARGIRIWAVIGDRHDVLPETQTILQTRISAYRRYNNRAAADEQLAGVQLDIEPYLLPGQTLAADLWRERYVSTVAGAMAIAGEALPLDLVMPVWWGTHPDWGTKLLDQLTYANLSITVMNYRTDFERLLQGALPFLDWGNRYDKPVRIALETGSLADEMQRSYVPDSTGGELWQFDIGAKPVLVLFSGPQQGLAGQSFRFSSAQLFSAGNLSFHGDQQLLNELAERLRDEWRDWPTFAGIAFHGLDEVYAEQ